MRPDEAELVRDIEKAAGVRFADVGMPEISAHDPMPAAELVEYADAGRAWVATDDDDVPVGYVVVDLVDDAAHVEQLAVHPDHQGVGLGRALIDEVERWARDAGLAALTLTTFSEVPWNRPLYEHLGFRALAVQELTAALLEIRENEAGFGLDPAIRVCMRRQI
jgi:GNAT superfamily N-acetyltransferase